MPGCKTVGSRELTVKGAAFWMGTPAVLGTGRNASGAGGGRTPVRSRARVRAPPVFEEAPGMSYRSATVTPHRGESLIAPLTGIEVGAGGSRRGVGCRLHAEALVQHPAAIQGDGDDADHDCQAQN